MQCQLITQLAAQQKNSQPVCTQLIRLPHCPGPQVVLYVCLIVSLLILFCKKKKKKFRTCTFAYFSVRAPYFHFHSSPHWAYRRLDQSTTSNLQMLKKLDSNEWMFSSALLHHHFLNHCFNRIFIVLMVFL